jgi:hypothetical protein
MTVHEIPTKRDVLIAAGLTAALMLAAVLTMARSSRCEGADFIAIYTPALMIREGRVGEVYNPEAQGRLQNELFHRPSVLLGIQPPFEFALIAPLTKFTYRKAYAVLGAIGVALWMLSMVLIRPYAPVPRNPLRYLLLGSLFFPAWVALLQGQLAIMMLVFWALTFIFIKQRQDFWGGVFLGLGLFKFAVALPFALICLLRGKWRLLGGFLCAALLLGGVAVAVVGVSGVHAYVDFMLDITRNPNNPVYRGIEPMKMPTLRGFLSVMLAGRVGSGFINAAAGLLSIPLIAFMAWRWRSEDQRADGGSHDLMFAASLVASVAVAPHLLTHDLTVVLLPVLLVIGSADLHRNRLCHLLITVSIVILFVPLYIFFVPNGGLFLLGPVLVAFALAASQISMAGDKRPEVD